MNCFNLLPSSGLVVRRWLDNGASNSQLEDALKTRWWEWSAEAANNVYHHLWNTDIQIFLNYTRRVYPHFYVSIGQYFGELLVIGIILGSGGGAEFECKCECSCGKIIHVKNYDLVSGKIWSCGCLSDCLTLRPLYHKWRTMLRRCNNPKDAGYKNYGGRGIRVCDEWEDFFVFETWGNLNGYKPGLTIERIDNDGNYCPENCRWATQKEQARNTRRTKNITYKGKTQCLSAWGEDLGIPGNVLSARLCSGWTIDRAFTTEY